MDETGTQPETIMRNLLLILLSVMILVTQGKEKDMAVMEGRTSNRVTTQKQSNTGNPWQQGVGESKGAYKGKSNAFAGVKAGGSAKQYGQTCRGQSRVGFY